MTINTKLNPDENCFFMLNNSVHQGKVLNVTLFLGPNTHLEQFFLVQDLEDGDSRRIMERNIARTREELLALL